MLTEYESTGIALDCIVSPQVLINIFEHNTPLHDGAIIVRGDRDRISDLLSSTVRQYGNPVRSWGPDIDAAVGMSEGE